MITFAEVHVLDRNAEHLGVPTERLMENAGRRVAEVVAHRYPDARVLILVGPGNNGGDGIVAARYLAHTHRVDVCLVRGEVRTPLARVNMERLPPEVGVLRYPIPLEGYDVYVDAMLGVGLSGTLREPYREIVRWLNSCDAPVVSVDVPTGLGTDVHVRPAVTVTFHDVKVGMSPENSGEIVVADIGIPEEAERFTGPGEFVLYPVPRESSHKGENGRVLVVGGGPYHGAPVLAALSALRTGADLAFLAVSASAHMCALRYPDLISRPVWETRMTREHLDIIMEMARSADAAVVGPGLGRDPKTMEAVVELVSSLEIPMVIDADAIKALAEHRDALRGKKAVITPHAREFQVFAGMEATEENVVKIASDLGITVLLKGHIDLITDGIRVKINRTGCAAMTVGGTGDVLSGIVGALLSKGMEPFDAARLGAYISGLAGEKAYGKKSYGMCASDVVENIGEVLKEHLSLQ